MEGKVSAQIVHLTPLVHLGSNLVKQKQRQEQRQPQFDAGGFKITQKSKRGKGRNNPRNSGKAEAKVVENVQGYSLKTLKVKRVVRHVFKPLIVLVFGLIFLFHLPLKKFHFAL